MPKLELKADYILKLVKILGRREAGLLNSGALSSVWLLGFCFSGVQMEDSTQTDAVVLLQLALDLVKKVSNL